MLLSRRLMAQPPAPAGGGSPSFLGDADTTAYLTSLTLNAASGGQTPLPAAFTGGNYAIIAVGADVTAITMDGDPLTLRIANPSGEKGALFDGAVAGGGTGDIVLTLSAATGNVGIAVWDIDTLTYVSSRYVYAGNRKLTIPAVIDQNTAAGNLVIGHSMHNKKTGGAHTEWVGTGWADLVDLRAVGARFLAAGHSLSAVGGAPESIDIFPDTDWTAVTGVLGVYG